jgi:hypothetical protein
VCGAKYNACYFSRYFSRTFVRFFRLSIFLSAQAFAVYQRISRQSFVGDFSFSVKKFYLFSAQLLRSSGGSLMKILSRLKLN